MTKAWTEMTLFKRATADYPRAMAEAHSKRERDDVGYWRGRALALGIAR